MKLSTAFAAVLSGSVLSVYTLGVTGAKATRDVFIGKKNNKKDDDMKYLRSIARDEKIIQSRYLQDSITLFKRQEEDRLSKQTQDSSTKKIKEERTKEEKTKEEKTSAGAKGGKGEDDSDDIEAAAEVDVVLPSVTPSAHDCLEVLGGLTLNQLRWAFTSYSLAQLAETGWAFDGVPDPDFISETRYWSEYCAAEDAECKAACPAEQVLIAGPPPPADQNNPPPDDVWWNFKTTVLTDYENGETYREMNGGVLDPYIALGTLAEKLEYAECHPNALVLFDYDDYIGSGSSTVETTAIATADIDPVFIEPSPTSMADGTYGLMNVVVNHGLETAPAVCALQNNVGPFVASADECLNELGGLSVDQLRWAFTSYSLAELQMTGWQFNGVPDPDFISETRYWSEYCPADDAVCKAACPPEQVEIAGPVPGTRAYMEFTSNVFVGGIEGNPETFRLPDGGVLDPYVALATTAEKLEYAECHPNALVIFDFDNFPTTSMTVLPTAVAADDAMPVYVLPSEATIADGTYPLEHAMVNHGLATPPATCPIEATVEVSAVKSAEACLAILRGLSLDQLRWAFTSYSLAELQATGWNFNGVPNPDFISSTRLWSEYCPTDDVPCNDACPAEQVKIVGPPVGSAVANEFKQIVLTDNANGETFRRPTDDILNPYVEIANSMEKIDYLQRNPTALGIADFAAFDAIIPSDILYTGIAADDTNSVYVLPSAETIAGGTYPLSFVAVLKSVPMTARTCVEVLGGLTLDQLRWAFTSYSLAELQADGWDFTGVPDPDFISETRFWSEYCPAGDMVCKDACPPKQVEISGPPAGTPVYDRFKELVLTGPEEEFRFEGGGVLNPYEVYDTADALAAHLLDVKLAVGLFDSAEEPAVVEHFDVGVTGGPLLEPTDPAYPLTNPATGLVITVATG